MIPGLSKPRILIGSAPHCDIRLNAPGVLPEHAAITHQGNGVLLFVDAGSGTSAAGGAPLPAGGSRPFDFRTDFTVAGAPVPNAHTALASILMSPGQAPIKTGEVVFGRDPARVNIVIQHPNVSGRHATFSL